MPRKPTEPNVFIIESLSFDDEQNDRFEGKFLAQILHLGEKESAYCYVQTENELKKALRLFGESHYRYLHLSCHGSEELVATTLDSTPFSKLGKLLQPYLRGKRLFISACSVVNDNFAASIIPSSGCNSIVGPEVKIDFNDAAIIWACFYHLVFKQDSERMDRESIRSALHTAADTFEVPLNYFSKDEDSPKGYKRERIVPKKH
jgi:hypothetical protein